MALASRSQGFRAARLQRFQKMHELDKVSLKGNEYRLLLMFASQALPRRKSRK
jgi:hypothetical protein